MLNIGSLLGQSKARHMSTRARSWKQETLSKCIQRPPWSPLSRTPHLVFGPIWCSYQMIKVCLAENWSQKETLHPSQSQVLASHCKMPHQIHKTENLLRSVNANLSNHYPKYGTWSYVICDYLVGFARSLLWRTEPSEELCLLPS